MGVGVGLTAAPAAAAMVEFSPAGQSSRAGSITTAAQALGLALALLVGGALIAYAPFPIRLNFWVLFVGMGFLVLNASQSAEVRSLSNTRYPLTTHQSLRKGDTLRPCVSTAVGWGACGLRCVGRADSTKTFACSLGVAVFRWIMFVSVVFPIIAAV
jgi:hypothetical protein